MSYLLTSSQTKCKASSVLNRSALYAAKNMFDGSLDTCWNSDKGLPQTIAINFEHLVSLSSISFMFQGGFVGVSGLVEASVNPLDQYILLTTLDNNIENSNELQVLPLPPSANFQYLRITFTSSTDFYGRITIYKLEVYGQEV